MLAYFHSQYVYDRQLIDILHTIINVNKKHPTLNFGVKQTLILQICI
jgi:hypothetical protein